MKLRLRPAALALAAVLAVSAQTPDYGPAPKAGPVEILPLDEVKPGMEAVAWTTFVGEEPEAMPLEILGVMHNAWGPKQDIILAKLGGKGARTNVAAGMSGSPVYHEGRLLGAISLRFSQFSPDAIAGITPIELMLEINEMDRSRPPSAASPTAGDAASVINNLGLEVWNSVGAEPPVDDQQFQPIETPVVVSGLHDGVLDVMGGWFRKQGYRFVQGGASARSLEKGDPDDALHPGEPIAAVLISGDMSATALGTTTYNDGRKVLGFGHAMFNSGPIEAPLATGDVVHVLASTFSPAKIANASSIVGALRQDRHSGIMGVLGQEAVVVPVQVTVRSFGEDDEVVEKAFRYEVFQNERWTPQLLMLSLFNSMFAVNDFSEETTYRLQGKMSFEGAHEVEFKTLQSVSNGPAPAPLVLAGSVAGKLQRVFANTSETPRIEGVEVMIDRLPERRVAVIEQVWVGQRRVRPGETLRGKVVLQPFRGDRFEESFAIRVPESAAKGRLTLTVSDASVANRTQQAVAQRLRTMSLPQAVSLLNQERSNDRIYITLADRSPTVHVGDQSLPNMPLTALAVMRPSAQGRLALETRSPLAETSIALDALISGLQTLTVEVE